MIQKLQEIHQVLESKENPKPSISMYTGYELGYLLFMTFYSLEYKETINVEKFELLISRMQSALMNEPKTSLDNGIIGMAYGMKIIESNLGVEICDSQFYKSVGDVSFDFASKQLDRNNYDMLHGGGGAILYLSKLNESKKLEQLINKLSQNSNSTDKGIYWSKKEINEEGQEVEKIDFGLAHGQASIICMLSGLLKRKQGRASVIKSLISKNVQFILENELPKGSKYLFPTMIINNKAESRSRLAWCYGDLGIAVSLLEAGEALEDQELKKEAIKIALRTTRLKNISDTHVADAGLCHGSAGIGHLYNRIYNKTGIVDFKNSANHWMAKTVRFGDGDSDTAGYTVWDTDSKKMKGEYGFIEGISGIGLAIMSHNCESQLEWDKLLFFN